MKICLTKEECYCSIPRLYDNIASRLGYDLDKVNYDCRKIDVSDEIFNQVDAFCKEQQGLDKGEIGMLWCAYGPKCSKELSNYEVDVQDGFIQEVG